MHDTGTAQVTSVCYLSFVLNVLIPLSNLFLSMFLSVCYTKMNDLSLIISLDKTSWISVHKTILLHETKIMCLRPYKMLKFHVVLLQSHWRFCPKKTSWIRGGRNSGLVILDCLERFVEKCTDLEMRALISRVLFLILVPAVVQHKASFNCQSQYFTSTFYKPKNYFLLLYFRQIRRRGSSRYSLWCMT